MEESTAPGKVSQPKLSTQNLQKEKWFMLDYIRLKNFASQYEVWI